MTREQVYGLQNLYAQHLPILISSSVPFELSLRLAENIQLSSLAFKGNSFVGNKYSQCLFHPKK